MDMSSELVIIFRARDESEYWLAASMLRGADIEFASKNIMTQNLFGVGQIGGYNPVHGSIEVQVLAHEVDSAREVLSDLLGNEHGSVTFDIPETCPACGQPTFKATNCPDCGLAFTTQSDSPPLPPETPTNVKAESARSATLSTIFGVLWLGGVGSFLTIHFGLKALRLARENTPPLRPPQKAIFGIVAGTLGLVGWVVFWLGVSRV